MPKFLLAKIDKYPLTTKYGETMKYVVENEKGTKVEMFRECFNKDWKENMTIELDEDKLEEKEYKGKKYFQYRKVLPIQEQSARVDKVVQAVDPLNERLSRIEMLLNMILAKVDKKDDFDVDEVNKSISALIDVDQIPF